MVYQNPHSFTARELFIAAEESEKVADRAQRDGPHPSFARVYRRAAWAMRIVGNVLKYRWRHVSRGTEYFEIGRGKLQFSKKVELVEGETMIAYVSADDGKIYFRSTKEFDDGRFERIIEETSS